MNKIRPNVLAIIIKDNHLLVQKGEDKETKKVFYRILGGGVEFGETSSEALKREFKEEINTTIVNEEFLCVTENIFDYNFGKYHEITFLYKADLLEKNIYLEKEIKIIDTDDGYAMWISIDDIKAGKVILYPEVTIKYL